MPYWRFYYHHLGATRGRERLIDGGLVKVVERSIRTTCKEQGVILHAVDVMPDHAHVAASIPPSLAVSTLVGRLKGASSPAVNAESTGTFSWQAEYGPLAFGEKALADVIAYVNNQHTRHPDHRLWPAMEPVADRVQPASAGLSG